MWNERYSNQFESYGTEPNDFVRAVGSAIPDGPVLVIAAGEGRDAVFLAELGYDVTAMDLSDVGMANTAALAKRRGVHVETMVADLTDFEFGRHKWAGIVSIWAHVPPELRREVHAKCVTALQPGGAFILEFYSPNHLMLEGKGGPPNDALLLTPDQAREELAGLTFVLCQEARRDVDEGLYHQGPSATTQVLAFH